MIGIGIGLKIVGGSGGGARAMGARISADIIFAGDIRQSNLVGGAISGVINLDADISLAAGVQIGAVISETPAFAADLIQTNLVAGAISATASFAGDVVAVSSSSRAYFAGDIEPGLYPEQMYGRELALLSSQTPETFEMQ